MKKSILLFYGFAIAAELACGVILNNEELLLAALFTLYMGWLYSVV